LPGFITGTRPGGQAGRPIGPGRAAWLQAQAIRLEKNN
jgi:hypothetical protein